MELEKLKTSNFEYGLTRLLSRGVKEIHGYISSEFGEPTFKMTKVELMDGTKIDCEGEHDFPYLAYNEDLDRVCEEVDREEDRRESDGTNEVK